jgi:nitroreductase
MTSVQSRLTSSDRDGFETVVRDPCHVRRFLDEEVPREDIEHMVGVATSAVSACNWQVWRVIAIQDRELIAAMQTAVLERFEQLALRPGLALQEQKRMVARAQALLFAKAPLCIAVLATPHDSPMEELMRLSGITREEHDRLCARPELQSAGAAVQLLTSTAHAMGYAACWTCAPIVAGERLEELLDVAAPARLVALVSVGRPAELPAARKRLPLEQVLSFR